MSSTSEVLDIAARYMRPGTTGDEIDRVVYQACVDRQIYPSPLKLDRTETFAAYMHIYMDIHIYIYLIWDDVCVSFTMFH